jgi:hypothetical protein
MSGEDTNHGLRFIILKKNKIMRASRVKLKIPSFGIEEWIILEQGNNKPLRYLLDKYIISNPISRAKGLAYAESGGYLKSLRYNDAVRGIIVNRESPSKLFGSFYVTVFWGYFILPLTGTYRGRLPRGGVPMDAIINFKDGDTLSLQLNTVVSNVPI